MKLIKKYQYGKSIEKEDNTNVNTKLPKRNIDKELYYYYNNIINKVFPKTFNDFKQSLINVGILPPLDDYSVPVGHLGDGYHSIEVKPSINYGPYDLPDMEVEGWGFTPTPEYSNQEWLNLARKTVQNDPELSMTDASKYMWSLDHPEFKIWPFHKYSIPVLPGPWNRNLYTVVSYNGYLPHDNPKYGGTGDKTVSYGEYPARSTVYKTKKYPPEDLHNKEHLYYMLNMFYNRKNGIDKKKVEY